MQYPDKQINTRLTMNLLRKILNLFRRNPTEYEYTQLQINNWAVTSNYQKSYFEQLREALIKK